MRPLIITIHKPLFNNFCYIRNEILRDAYIHFLKGGKVIVRIPQGDGEINPKVWKETGKRMSKVFKIKNRPMILYGNYVPLAGTVTKTEPTLEAIQNKLL